MNSVLDIATNAYDILQTPAVLDETKVFKFRRKRVGIKDTESDWIVVNAIGIDGDQLQKGVANVNIFARDIHAEFDGESDYYPNTARLKELQDIVLPLFKDANINDSISEIEAITMLTDEATQSHYLNIRVIFYAINLL